MTDYADVPPEIVAALRSACLRLPEVHEEQAWAGRRWRIRNRTFAHVLTVDSGGRQSRGGEPSDALVTVLTFRSSGPELDALRRAGHPFFRPGAPASAVGMVLDAATDWDEVGELVTESYCLLAPKKLAALVDRPAAVDDPGRPV